MPQYTLNQISNALTSSGYCPNDDILFAVWTALVSERPLLLEGAPGVGKTSLAKALADGLGLKYIRLQMYEGLTDDKILYDYDYQKQLLTLEAIRPKLEETYKDLSLNESIQQVLGSLDFYGKDFLIQRPILKSIMGDDRYVLCIDELDKAPEEIEYQLYEFLESYTLSIPQYGDVVCPEDKRPIVFITSNGYRDLSGALRRRCNYLYLEEKTQSEMMEILETKTKIDSSVASGIAQCFVKFQNANLRQIPSISEAIEYADFLGKNEDITKDLALKALSIIIKNHQDESIITRIVDENGEEIWSKSDNKSIENQLSLEGLEGLELEDPDDED